MYVAIRAGFSKEDGLEIDLLQEMWLMQHMRKHRFIHNKKIKLYNHIGNANSIHIYH